MISGILTGSKELVTALFFLPFSPEKYKHYFLLNLI
jgi:hypothetical protein